MNFSTTGYRDDSPDRKNKSNVILSNNISMDGVSIPITAVPIYNGKPDYTKKKLLRPGDKNTYFPGAEAVLEMPFAQEGIGGVGGNPYITSPFENKTTYGLDIQPSAGPTDEEVERVRQLAMDYNIIPPTSTNRQDTPNTQYTWGDFLSGLGTSRDTASAFETAGYYSNLKTNDMEWASPQAKKQAKAGQTLGIIGGFGAGILGSAKSFLSGAALANRESQAAQERDEEYRDTMENRVTYYGTRKNGGSIFMQDGGKVSDEKILTGAYTTGIPSGSPIQPNVEVEAGEYLQSPTGEVSEVLGNKHSQGGEMMDLEDTDVISDHLKVGKKLAKLFSEQFDIKVKPTDTFATVIDKEKKAIGLTRLLEEYEAVIGKIKKQEEVEDDATRELNLSFLSKNVQDLEAQIEPMNSELEAATKFVFQEQERQKVEEAEKAVYRKGGTKLYQEGGTITPDETEQILKAFAQVSGVTYEEIVQGFSLLSGQEKEQALNEMVAQIEASSGAAGAQDMEQVVMAYAEMQGIDPNALMQELESLPEEELQQALQEMASVVMQAQEQMQESANPQSEEMMEDGGKTGGPKTAQEFLDYLTGYTGSANYDYGDLDNTRKRGARLFLVNKLKSEGIDFDKNMTQEELDRVFGIMQGQMNELYPDVMQHYMGTRSNTKQDLDFYLDNGLVTKGFLENLGVKFGKDGKVTRGIREQNLARSVDDAIYSEIQKTASEKGLEDTLSEYRGVGFQDNKAYYRGVEVQPVMFDSEDNFNSFVNDNGYTLVSNSGDKPIYFSNKEGLYFTPEYVEDTPTPSPTDPEEAPAQPKGTNFNKYEVDAQGRRVALPWRDMDQSIWLNPALDLPRKLQVSPVLLQGYQESPQEELNEINKQRDLALAMMDYAPDSVRGSQGANIQALTTEGANKTFSNLRKHNAQFNQWLEERNDSNINAAQRMNIELAGDYDTKYLMAKANLESHMLGRDQYMRQWEAMKERNRWNRNAAAATYSQFALGPNGEIVPIPNQKLTTGIPEPYNPSKETKTTTKKKNPDGSTTTQTQTVKTGGTIKTYLEKTMFK